MAKDKIEHYHLEYKVCYPCEKNGSDPIACKCITDASAADYGWRHETDYEPLQGGSVPYNFMAAAAAGWAGTHWAGPNSNSFARYFMYRCTKEGRRPSMPSGAAGWDFQFGRDEDYPPPWGGVNRSEGESYY